MRLLDSFLLGQWGASIEKDEDEGQVAGRDAVDADREGLGNELVALSIVAELMAAQHNDSDPHAIGKPCSAPGLVKTSTKNIAS